MTAERSRSRTRNPEPGTSRLAPRAPRPASGTRDRVLAAAASEFAARGYAGAKVDRIARAARVNKAMIYYHFKSKAALYREILRGMFEAVRARVDAIAAASDRAPDDKVRAYIAAIADEAAARPYFPPIWFREIAEGGEHVDPRIFDTMRGVLAALGAIIAEGGAQGRFRPINPMLLQGGIIAPLMFFIITSSLRQRIARGGAPDVAGISREAVVAHVERIALAVLEGRI